MTPHQHSGRARRAALLVTASAVILACFWAFGGAGFASSSISANQYQYGGKKVKVCHNGKKTIRISRSALPAHLAHSDTVGKCKKDKGKHRGDGKKHDGDDRGKGEKSDEGEKKSDRSEKSDRSKRAEKPDRSEKSDRGDDRGNGNGKGKGRD